MMSRLNRFGVAVVLFLILGVLLYTVPLIYEEVLIILVIGVLAVAAIVFD